ncbi:MAG: hypothetical protein KME32_00595 [Mojavia pulchra JT2-VF2]|jgi:hypothetical protein|uniref:Uncharacterized protein n=1 Tax=Mojavia pulchra JT2-VF2 TaxID=287848 RepID=A0A951UE54_9NOST|nr:hypothetical protein [Mojavia pulchra JT2-VF2]
MMPKIYHQQHQQNTQILTNPRIGNADCYQLLKKSHHLTLWFAPQKLAETTEKKAVERRQSKEGRLPE